MFSRLRGKKADKAAKPDSSADSASSRQREASPFSGAAPGALRPPPPPPPSSPGARRRATTALAFCCFMRCLSSEACEAQQPLRHTARCHFK